jgi:hypothetical protein
MFSYTRVEAVSGKGFMVQATSVFPTFIMILFFLLNAKRWEKQKGTEFCNILNTNGLYDKYVMIVNHNRK